ncbi:hypothetical protein PGT21_031145 [Puccinia graminis f. sp. tritici]|uniref:CCHC-type domain-containing protein n=1 Tax=Puccinia graminis f. sp. tritici TaxID=56615 RepID=A0A5B0N5Q6_PUCGR|nr:hypothetical protein PGT21_031145 [Puccinia graminis f. sp. tritici]KAA1099190.1 hypothetical protein PGTUg99_019258 [Puccinia graminis f. sp. tritici]
MSFPGQFFTPADHNIEKERAWNDSSDSSDSDGSGSTITQIVRQNQSSAEDKGKQRAETLDDLIAEGRSLVDQVRKNGFVGNEVAEKVKLFKGQASVSSKKVGTYGVPSEGSKERMNVDDPTPPRSLGLLKAKIRPKDYPNIRFSTTKVARFLERFKAAADGEGAEDSDKVWQVVNFIQDEEALWDVEDMDGYEKKDWAELKKEMLEKWGQSKQRYREADLDRLAAEMAEKGGVQTREQYRKYVSSFDWILKYLNRNKIVTDTPGAVKRTFIKAFPKEMRERALRQLFDRDMVKRSKDGGVIVLPDMKEIRKALQGEMDMQELVEEGIEAGGSGSVKGKEPVSAKEVSELADTLKELRLFMQKMVTQSWKPPAGCAGADTTPAAPEAATKGQGFAPRGPPACSYCGSTGHFKSQCQDLTMDIKTLGVCPSMRDYYLDGEKIEAAIPRDKVRKRRSADSPATAKGKEAEVKSHIGIVERGRAWTPPAVAAEVRAMEIDAVLAAEIEATGFTHLAWRAEAKARKLCICCGFRFDKAHKEIHACPVDPELHLKTRDMVDLWRKWGGPLRQEDGHGRPADTYCPVRAESLSARFSNKRSEVPCVDKGKKRESVSQVNHQPSAKRSSDDSVFAGREAANASTSCEEQEPMTAGELFFASKLANMDIKDCLSTYADALVLVDSGASASFINKEFVNTNKVGFR